MPVMTRHPEDDRSALLAAREREYERLALCYAGLIARCGRLGELVVERLELCRAQQERLTAGHSPG
jgi:hypothetical protein